MKQWKKAFLHLGGGVLAHEHDLGNYWWGKVKNRTSKLYYVIELFGSVLCLPLVFFFTRRHSISLLSANSRTLCYLILFGGRFTSTIRRMIPADDKIQNSKSGNFTERKMRSYWNYLWFVFNSGNSCWRSPNHSICWCFSIQWNSLFAF